MSLLALSASFKYLCYGCTVIINILIISLRRPHYISESDVYTHHILTYRDGARAEKVKGITYLSFFCVVLIRVEFGEQRTGGAGAGGKQEKSKSPFW